MNDRDVLKRASGALQESTEPTPAELAALRARVLSNKVAPLSAAQRAKRLRWILPLAAAFVAGSALAATPGAWEGVVDSVERMLHVELLPRAHEAARSPRRSSAPVLAPRAAPPAEPPTVAAAEPAPVTPSAGEPALQASAGVGQGAPDEASARRPRTAEASAAAAHTPGAAKAPAGSMPPNTQQTAATAEPVQPEPQPTPALTSTDLLLYRQAHELHFRAREYAAALAAWDTYLRKVPNGTLRLEAEYNRAVCLIRLGRYTEARAALAPFATGQRGGYRRDEAASFLRSLEKLP